jgi:hypothetical protein
MVSRTCFPPRAKGHRAFEFMFLDLHPTSLSVTSFCPLAHSFYESSIRSVRQASNVLRTNTYQDDQGGTIWVRVAHGADDMIELSVRDEGRGLPANFELRSARGLGIRIVRAFSEQLTATVKVHRLDPGTEFVVTAPREPKL